MEERRQSKEGVGESGEETKGEMRSKSCLKKRKDMCVFSLCSCVFYDVLI